MTDPDSVPADTLTLLHAKALELTAATGDTLTNEALAKAAEVPLKTVNAAFPTRAALIQALVGPYYDDLEETLKTLPIMPRPNYAHQRSTLKALLDTAFRHREACLVLTRLGSSEIEAAFDERNRSMMFQSGIRLIGADFDPTDDLFLPVFLAIVSITVAAATQRIDLQIAERRTLVVDALTRMIPPETRGK